MVKRLENNICKHWFEDYFKYSPKEICGANNRIVTCSGVRKQCNYPNCFEKEDNHDNTKR